jgi:hypothetical protein
MNGKRGSKAMANNIGHSFPHKDRKTAKNIKAINNKNKKANMLPAK